jgi:adenylate cyclase
MAAVDFAESSGGPSTSAVVHGRARLLDVCDDARAPVRFGCRAARCTTCRVEVLEGEDLLEPAGPEEIELLVVIGAPSHVRLACQAVVRDGTGKLRLRWIGPEVSGLGAARRA